MYKIKLMLNALVFVMSIAFAVQANAGVVVIGNIDEPVDKLSTRQASSIFLQLTKTFPGGGVVQAVDLPYGDAVRDEFYLKVTGKDARKIRIFWAKRLFVGKGRPNDILLTESAVIKWVGEAIGRVGYVSTDAVNESVKVLLRLP